MANQQLVDYIKQQLQGGVQKDAVKKALLDAGWPQNDVDESLKAAAPETAAPAVAAVASPAVTVNPSAAMGSGMNMMAAVSAGSSDKNSYFSSEAEVEKPPHSMARIAMSVMGAVIVILIGTLGYIYYSLNGRATAAAGQNANSASEVAALKNQVQTLSTDKEALTTQTASLSTENQELLNELSFFVAVPGASQDAAKTVKGTISVVSGTYALTTPHNLKITIKNSKDARVDGALKPLVGQVAELQGAYKLGATELTLAAVNGVALAPAATSTASSTAAATTTTP